MPPLQQVVQLLSYSVLPTGPLTDLYCGTFTVDTNPPLVISVVYCGAESRCSSFPSTTQDL